MCMRYTAVILPYLWVLSCRVSQQSRSMTVCTCALLLAGKTTLLRDITRQLADAFHKLVMVVDTSEEIAGGGDLPHSCIGSARRMLGTRHQSKYEVLEEAVANHGPEVIMLINTVVSMVESRCSTCSNSGCTNMYSHNDVLSKVIQLYLDSRQWLDYY